MSLITRCPACGTSFRVVPDQLRVAQGWVRCGQCEEVFDGQAQLQSAGAHEAPAALPVSEALPSSNLEQPAVADATETAAPYSGPSTTEDNVPQPADSAAQATVAESPAHAKAVNDPYDWGDVLPASSSASVQSTQEDDKRWDGADVVEPVSSLTEPDAPMATLVQEVPETQEVQGHTGAPGPGPDPLLDKSPNELAAAASAPAPGDWNVSPLEELSGFDESVLPESLRYVQADGPLPEPVDAVRPTFMAHKQGKRGFVHSPRLMGALVVFLFLGLLLQVLVHERDRLAATVPSTEPVLASLCGLLGCELSPPRNIAAIAIESSSFAKVRGDVFRLSFTLKNAGTIPLAVPAVELTLADSQDQTIVRRVLLPTEFAGKRLSIAAQGELAASLPVQVRAGKDAERVASYVVLGFYP